MRKNKEEVTSIQILNKTRDRILRNGKMRETYDDVIGRAFDKLGWK